MTAASHKDDPVTIADRRELPFFHGLHARGRADPRTRENIAKMLTCLEQAVVLRRETQPDLERGGSISIAHLLIDEHSFIHRRDGPDGSRQALP
jgi:hypothetical protein